MNRLCDPAEIERLKRKYGFALSRDFSQNFLTDESVPARIVEAAAPDGRFCLEIGPGFGALTSVLCDRAERVASIEVDRRLYPVLAETVGSRENFTLIEGDATRCDLDALAKKSPEQNIICGNLPYNITTKLVRRILPLQNYRAAYLMVQLEAAERLCAPPGAPACSELTYQVHYYTEPRILFEVPREAFCPPPAVRSAVIELRFREDRPPADPAFFALIEDAFRQRRKTLQNNLGKKYGKEKVRAALEKLALPPDIRGERLTLSEFRALFDKLFTI